VLLRKDAAVIMKVNNRNDIMQARGVSKFFMCTWLKVIDSTKKAFLSGSKECKSDMGRIIPQFLNNHAQFLIAALLGSQSPIPCN